MVQELEGQDWAALVRAKQKVRTELEDGKVYEGTLLAVDEVMGEAVLFLPRQQKRITVQLEDLRV